MASEFAVMNIEDKKKVLLNSPVPVLPVNLNRLLHSFESDNMTHLKLAKIIADFPSIAARLLFLANSAWAAPRHPIENLETACARLGFSMVRNVSISLCIVSPFNVSNKCPAFNLERFWCCSLLTAEGASMLGTSINANDISISTLHTAGLLHNLGLLWLAGNWPEQTSNALDQAAAYNDQMVSEALRATIGFDYFEAGGIIGRAWKLPDVLISAMEHHCPDLYPKSKHTSTIFVGYAAEMVASLQAGNESRPEFPKEIDISFDPNHIDRIYQQLGERLNRTLKLASTLFSV